MGVGETRIEPIGGSAAVPPKSEIQPSTRVPALDGVRGIAILLVLVRHAWPNVFPVAGLLGVEVFFVLSGYLITRILLADVGAGRLSLRRFYRNRALRLVPALVCVVLATAFIRTLIHPLAGTHVASGVVVALAYLTDLRSVFGLHIIPDLGNLWTLGVEEQFYLLWPLLLIGLVRLTQRGHRRAAVLLLVIGVGGEVVIAYTHRATLQTAQELPLIWAPALLAGCLLAGRPRPIAGERAALAAIAVIFSFSFIPSGGTRLVTYLTVVPLVALLSCAVVSNAASGTAVAVLRIRWLCWLGLISYGAYLWNYPVAQWVGGVPSIPITILLATASYVFVERRFLRKKRHGVQPIAAVAVAAEGTAGTGQRLPADSAFLDTESSRSRHKLVRTET
jgi:peptidoglycan/LPS O-acetylase OafA/YrhL